LRRDRKLILICDLSSAYWAQSPHPARKNGRASNRKLPILSNRNLGGAFDPAINGPVRLTSARVPWSDPPQGGGYADGFGGDATPDFSFPFYYDPAVDLPGQEDGSPEVACTLPNAGAGKTLNFHDAPADDCLRGGSDVGAAICDFKAEPKGSYGGYKTRLVGINFDGTPTDLGIGFTWTSTYNGTTGRVHIKKTLLAGDDNGTGGVTITSVSDQTNLDFGVTTINDVPPGVFPALSSGDACNGTFGGAFTGDVVISTGQSCTFINATITGNVHQNGGALVLTAMQVSGDVHIRGESMFSIGSLTVIGSDLIIRGNGGDDDEGEDEDGDRRTSNMPNSTPPNQICGTIVQRNLDVRKNKTAVQIGSDSDSSCAGNLIGGDLEVEQNLASIAIFDSSVVGNLEVEDNTGQIAIFDNIISGNLRCEDNSAITGAGNEAKRKQGQCSLF